MEQGLTTHAGYGKKQYAQVEAAARGWVELTYLCGPAESLSTGGSGRVTLNMVGEIGTVQSIVWGRFDSYFVIVGQYTQYCYRDIALLPSVANDDEGTILSLDVSVVQGDSEKAVSVESRFRDGTVDILRRVSGSSFVVWGRRRTIRPSRFRTRPVCGPVILIIGHAQRPWTTENSMVNVRAVAFTLVVLSGMARAERNVETPIIDNTTYQLNQNEWRIGLLIWIMVSRTPLKFGLFIAPTVEGVQSDSEGARLRIRQPPLCIAIGVLSGRCTIL